MSWSAIIKTTKMCMHAKSVFCSSNAPNWQPYKGSIPYAGIWEDSEQFGNLFYLKGTKATCSVVMLYVRQGELYHRHGLTYIPGLPDSDFRRVKTDAHGATGNLIVE